MRSSDARRPARGHAGRPRGGLLHLDCFSGLAGDMFLGACLDLGLPLTTVQAAVDRLDVPGLALESRRARRGGVSGVRFRVLLGGGALEGPDPDEPDGGVGRRRAAAGGPWAGRAVPVAELRRTIAGAGLAPAVAGQALAMLERLTAAEVEATGVAPAAVEWPEPAALDLLVDLVGAAAAVEALAPARVSCGPVCVGGGGGPVGTLAPRPGPTTARLLRGVPVVGGEGGELVTPTGAALLAELVDEFRPLPPMTLARVGYGLGRAELGEWPNAVRIWSGEALAEAPAAVSEAGSGDG